MKRTNQKNKLREKVWGACEREPFHSTLELQDLPQLERGTEPYIDYDFNLKVTK